MQSLVEANWVSHCFPLWCLCGMLIAHCLSSISLSLVFSLAVGLVHSFLVSCFFPLRVQCKWGFIVRRLVCLPCWCFFRIKRRMMTAWNEYAADDSWTLWHGSIGSYRLTVVVMIFFIYYLHVKRDGKTGWSLWLPSSAESFLVSSISSQVLLTLAVPFAVVALYFVLFSPFLDPNLARMCICSSLRFGSDVCLRQTHRLDYCALVSFCLFYIPAVCISMAMEKASWWWHTNCLSSINTHFSVC